MVRKYIECKLYITKIQNVVTGDFMNILVSISTVMNIKLFLALDYKILFTK